MAERDFVVGAGIVADNTPIISETAIITTSSNVIASFDKDAAKAAEFTVKVEQGNRLRSIKSLALHNGIIVDITQYGELSIGAVEEVPGSGATTWVTQESNFGTTTIQSVAFGNSLWVAAGRTGQLRTSTDAITWTTRTSNFGNTNIISVAFGNNLWVAGGYRAQIRTSTDAITWTTRTSNFGTFDDILSVAFGDNLWVAGGSTGTLRTSSDAITWITRTSNFGNTNIISVAFGNNLWVAVGVASQIRTSTDAITWTTQTSNFGGTAINSVAYGNELWVAGGGYAELHTSSTDTAFNEIPLSLSADISGSDVRLLATVTDADTLNATATVLTTKL